MLSQNVLSASLQKLEQMCGLHHESVRLNFQAIFDFETNKKIVTRVNQTINILETTLQQTQNYNKFHNGHKDRSRRLAM